MLGDIRPSVSDRHNIDKHTAASRLHVNGRFFTLSLAWNFFYEQFYEKEHIKKYLRPTKSYEMRSNENHEGNSHLTCLSVCKLRMLW